MSAISEALAPYPSAGLSLGPTPLHALPRLTARLGRRIHALREDLTGFALGGNKVRKLDYLLGDALAKGADALLTQHASSFSRNAAAAGRVFGLAVHVVLPGAEAEHNAASRELFARLGAELHPGVPYAEVRARLASTHRSLYELHPGGSDEIGTLGYVSVFDRIVAHTEATGVHFDAIVVPSGSAATQAGLLLGQALSGYDTRVLGMAISQPTAVQRERVGRLAASTAELLGVGFDASTLHVDDRFLGDGYALPTPAGTAAARTFAQLEGLLLDPVYTAKAAAGLIHHAEQGLIGEDEDVLFVHTGGQLGLFDAPS